jgi:hypothetical protein
MPNGTEKSSQDRDCQRHPQGIWRDIHIRGGGRRALGANKTAMAGLGITQAAKINNPAGSQ